MRLAVSLNWIIRSLTCTRPNYQPGINIKKIRYVFGVACAVMVFVLVGGGVSNQTVMADFNQASRQRTPSLPVEATENKESNVSLLGIMSNDLAEKPQSKP